MPEALVAHESGPWRRRALWVVPVAFLVHNLEEALTIPHALPRIHAAWSGWTGRALQLPNASQYHQVLVGLTAAGFVLLLLARLWDRASYALVVLQAVMTLNVAMHVAGAVLLRGYAPGLVSAVLVEAPVSFLVWRRVRDGGWMSRRQWRLLPLWVAILHGPGLIGLLLWVRRG